MSGQFDFVWLRFYLFFTDSDSRTYFKFYVTVKCVVCVCVCVSLYTWEVWKFWIQCWRVQACHYLFGCKQWRQWQQTVRQQLQSQSFQDLFIFCFGFTCFSSILIHEHISSFMLLSNVCVCVRAYVCVCVCVCVCFTVCVRCVDILNSRLKSPSLPLFVWL